MTSRRWKILGWCGGAIAMAAIVLGGIAAVSRDGLSSSDPAPDNSSYRFDGDSIELTADAAKRADITEVTVEKRDVPMTLTLTGRTGLNADNVTHIHAQFGGKLVQVGPELGARVKGPGDVGGPTLLCVIESNDLAQAKANWISATVQLKLDTETLARTRELVKSTVLAPKFLIDAESAVTKDQAAVEAARQQLLIFGLTQAEIDNVQSQVGRQRMDYVITSPRGGVVAEKGVAGGEIADPTMNLFTIADTSTMWAWGDVYERDLPLIKVGQPAEMVFTSDPDHPRPCKIEWISPSLDPNTHSVRIRATLANPDGLLLADMYATMIVTIDPGRDSLVIPAEAVVRKDAAAFVFVKSAVKGNATRYRCKAVRIAPLNAGFGASSSASTALGSAARNSDGSQDMASVRVVEGVGAGDVIVRNGALGLFNEMEQQARDR